MTIDAQDRKILNLLQKDATLTNQEIAHQVGGSGTAIWRRIQRLEEQGVIRGNVALLDRQAIGLEICMICNVKLKRHSDESRNTFESLVASRREVTECYATSGEYDYMLIVVVSDVSTYEHFLTNILLNSPPVETANSSLTLREIKYTTAVTI
jgi:Lrp/AsnC family leucine-responsive transcriptional regulator